VVALRRTLGKAVAAAQAQEQEQTLPSTILAAIAAAPRYAEGRGLRVPVRTASDVRALANLVSLKMARR